MFLVMPIALFISEAVRATGSRLLSFAGGDTSLWLETHVASVVDDSASCRRVDWLEASRFFFTVGTKRFRCAEVWFLPAAEKDVVRDVTEKRLLHRFYFLHRDTEPNGFSTPCLRFMFFS